MLLVCLPKDATNDEHFLSLTLQSVNSIVALYIA